MLGEEWRIQSVTGVMAGVILAEASLGLGHKDKQEIDGREGRKGIPDGRNILTNTKGSLNFGSGWETEAGGMVGGGVLGESFQVKPRWV